MGARSCRSLCVPVRDLHHVIPFWLLHLFIHVDGLCMGHLCCCRGFWSGVESFLEDGKDLKEGRSLPIQKLQSELEVLQSLPEVKEQHIENGQTIFQR